jgi:hypothetical protein
VVLQGERDFDNVADLEFLAWTLKPDATHAKINGFRLLCTP